MLREVEPAPRNALWDLFSFQAEKVQQGAKAYHWRQPDHVPVLNEIYQRYRELGIAMPYTFEDFHRDLALDLLKKLPPEERMRGLPIEDRLRGLNDAERTRLKELLDDQKTTDQRH